MQNKIWLISAAWTKSNPQQAAESAVGWQF